MTARGRLRHTLLHRTTEAGADELLDAYRAEVLREAADAVMVRAEQTEDMKARMGLGVAHWVLTEMAAATPTSKES